MTLPEFVRIYEVGPRDGLQNESQIVPTMVKIALIERLADAGFSHVEATSFVSPEAVPQMADHKEVMEGITRREGVIYPVLVPNIRGMEAALKTGAQEVAIFASASEAFSNKNINCSIEESYNRFLPVMQMAKDAGVPVRGYVSCVLGCPYEGDIMPEAVADVAKQLHHMGCYEISLGDTIGVGKPDQVRRLLEVVIGRVPVESLALHFHDTYGRALDNIRVGLEMGVCVVDSSVAGLGGCPYAKGATGNVASEDVIDMLNGLGITTNVNIDKVIETAQFISKYLGREPSSKIDRAKKMGATE
ncbi:MAG: hydroxymethylglutaryl-CoA lyase [Zetaproteobacteria bacterium]|nr:MAG: hydroxymethylglutaryl-CoA lyase [Zetaproteobacteria bacterium]